MHPIFYLFVSVIALFNTSVQAQEKYIITLADEPLRTDSLGFRIDSVADYRPHKATLGTIQKGAFNRKVTANFPQDLSRYMTDYVRARQTPLSAPVRSESARLGSGQATNATQSKPGNVVPLVLVINELTIGETTAMMSEKGYAQATMLVCRPDSAGQPGVLFEWTGQVESGGLDVTAGHARRIRQLLTDCLTEFSKTDWTTQTPEPLGADYAVKGVENGDKLHNIATFPKGFYRTLGDLLTARPTDTTLSAYTITLRKNRLTARHVTERRRAGFFFAYSDGESVFINSRGYVPNQIMGFYFAKADLLGRYVVVKDRFSDPTMMAAFGLTGALVSARDAAFLDTRTGRFHALEEDTMRDIILKDFPEWGQRYAKQKRGDYVTRRAYIASVNQHYAEEVPPINP